MAVVEAVEPVIYGNVRTGIAFDAIVGAIVAGVIVGLAKKAFLNRVPDYVEIIIGAGLLLMYGNYDVIRGIGYILIADGVYDLIKNYISVKS